MAESGPAQGRPRCSALAPGTADHPDGSHRPHLYLTLPFPPLWPQATFQTRETPILSRSFPVKSQKPHPTNLRPSSSSSCLPRLQLFLFQLSTFSCQVEKLTYICEAKNLGSRSSSTEQHGGHRNTKLRGRPGSVSVAGQITPARDVHVPISKHVNVCYLTWQRRLRLQVS